MTLIILSTIHPVACMAEVGDILGLSAVAVAQDNAFSTFGNIALELGLSIVVGDRLSLRSAGPFAVELIAVVVPSIDIGSTPAEVVGQQEVSLILVVLFATTAAGAAFDLIEVNHVMTFAVEPVNGISTVC